MVMVLVPTRRDPPSAADFARGQKLQALRLRVGKTQRQVANALGISFKTVSAYENGRADLGAEDFEEWARALGVSVAELTSSLGFGLPAETGCLGRDLAALFGPDAGDEVERLMREMADLPDDERRQIIRAIRYQIAGRNALQGN